MFLWINYVFNIIPFNLGKRIKGRDKYVNHKAPPKKKIFVNVSYGNFQNFLMSKMGIITLTDKL